MAINISRANRNLAIFVGACLLFCLLLYGHWISSPLIGVGAEKLEQDARENCYIAETWQMIESTSSDGNFVAMLFYDFAQTDYTLVTYRKTDEPFHFGYFCCGVASGVVETCSFNFNGDYVTVYSLNPSDIAKLEVKKMDETLTFQLDSKSLLW